VNPSGNEGTLWGYSAARFKGFTDTPVVIHSYREIPGKEAEITGSSDQLPSQFPLLIELAWWGWPELSDMVRRIVPLGADACKQHRLNMDISMISERSSYRESTRRS
jgi:hypothetical protein